MVTVRQAALEDVETIVRWRQETAVWLRGRGSDQWGHAGLDRNQFAARVRGSIDRGETWIAEDSGRPVGTIAVDKYTDPDLWTDDELAGGVVIHRMIVPRSESGRGIGDVLLSQAEQVARTRGATRLLLDAWTTNHDLHAYYRRQGFEHVRTVPEYPGPSAALFARTVAPTDVATSQHS